MLTLNIEGSRPFRARDAPDSFRKLLMITGALGIQFTGAAIAQALRDMSPAVVTAAGEFQVITNLIRLYIWWQVFREKPRTRPSVSIPGN